MKILYAIQGTGNGHLSRAKAIYPELCKHGNVDVLLSGIQVELKTDFPVKYRLKGLSFIFGSTGGVDMLNTALQNNIFTFLKEIKSLPVKDYDLIISDFEPVSAWACKLANKRCVGLSNQVALLDKNVPKSRKIDPFGWLILKYYAPTKSSIGFHFRSYSKSIFTPIISEQVRSLSVANKGHILVYLPAFSDRVLVPYFRKFSAYNFHIFSKRALDAYKSENIQVYPISEQKFLRSLGNCAAVITAAGFGLTSEALFLKKKLLVVPMNQQIEQACNAEALEQMGVPVVKALTQKNQKTFLNFFESAQCVEVNYPNNIEQIVRAIFRASNQEIQAQVLEQG